MSAPTNKAQASEPQAASAERWEVCEETIYAKCAIRVQGSQMLVADVYGDGQDERKARQALIAAAPETKAQRDQLLAACKAALGAIESGDPSMSERSMLIAAIARAEGKEQAQ